MAQKETKPEDLKTLATLTLAASIVKDDVKSASEALNAGADLDAFWIDGRTRLRELVLGRHPQYVRTYASVEMANLFAPQSLKTVPPRKTDHSFWTREFVRFVAMRGHSFDGNTILAGKQVGVRIKPILTAKAAVRRIDSKWSLLEDATCSDESEGKSSRWRLLFDSDWIGDRRIVGFRIDFTVDARGWEVVEMFEAAKRAGAVGDLPSLGDPLVFRQKDWEGENIADETLDSNGGDVDDMIACMRKGGSPFFKFQGAFIGHIGETPEAGAFMDALRKAVGPGPGWHIRIAPLLTKNSMQALRDKSALKLATPKSKSRKKSLKDRTDIM